VSPDKTALLHITFIIIIMIIMVVNGQLQRTTKDGCKF